MFRNEMYEDMKRTKELFALFPDGHTTIASVLNALALEQANAIWESMRY